MLTKEEQAVMVEIKQQIAEAEKNLAILLPLIGTERGVVLTYVAALKELTQLRLIVMLLGG